MKRDMELVRKVLFAIEEQSDGTDILDLKIEGYDEKTVAYHCKILHDGGLVMNYEACYADIDYLDSFCVGSLSWEGNEFLDKIRSDTIWNNTKEMIISKGLPMALDVIKEVASNFVAMATMGAFNGMM